MKTKTSLVSLLAGVIITATGTYNAAYSSEEADILNQMNAPREEILAKGEESGFHLVYGGILGPALVGFGGLSLYRNYERRDSERVK